MPNASTSREIEAAFSTLVRKRNVRTFSSVAMLSP